MNPIIGELTTQAATIMMQNTASIIAAKVQSIKAKKNDKEAVSELTEIINDLVEDNAQLQSLAQAYRQELVAQQITAEDIEYITDTLIPILEQMMRLGEKPVPQSTFDVMRQLLSKETLNVLQLLGFNFKQAVGVPLTRLLADYISSQSPMGRQQDMQRDMLALQLKMIELAQDHEAYERYLSLIRSEEQNRA